MGSQIVSTNLKGLKLLKHQFEESGVVKTHIKEFVVVK